MEFPSQLLQLAISHGVPQFINTGTYFQYAPDPLPIKETNQLLPFNEYAKTKIEFSNVLRHYSQQISIQDLTLFSPYGPRDNDKLIMYIVKNIVQGNVLELSEGFQKIDLVYVEDVAISIYKCILSDMSNAPGYTNLNIASGSPASVRDVVSLVEEITGLTGQKNWGPPSENDYPIVYGDIEKAKRLIGWGPKVNLRMGLTKTLDFVKGVLPR